MILGSILRNLLILVLIFGISCAVKWFKGGNLEIENISNYANLFFLFRAFNRIFHAPMTSSLEFGILILALDVESEKLTILFLISLAL